MKIAIVLNTSWNIYNFRLGLVKELIERGHQVIAIAPLDNYSSKLEEAGCQYIPLTMDSRGANPVKDFALIFELRKLYKKCQPDIILHFTIKPNIYGTFAAWMLGIPVINNVCGLGTVFLKKGIVSMVAKLLYKIAFIYPHHIFFQNKFDQKLFMDKSLCTENPASLLPGSGIDLKHFNPPETKLNTHFKFLMISRVIKDKGIEEYVAAAKILKQKGVNATFNLLGQLDPQHKRGISIETFENWKGEGFINYLGTTNDVRTVIADNDCVVLPSYREGTPRTLLEGAAMKKPLIATDVPGCNNVVHHNSNGLLCKLKNIESLAGQMEKMFHMKPEIRAAMGEKGRMLVENNFDEHLVIENYNYQINKFKNSGNTLKRRNLIGYLANNFKLAINGNYQNRI